jgi:hypothetical protein
VRTFLVLSTLVLGMLVTAGVAIGDPNLSNVSPHRHFINGTEVGPRLCDNLGDPGLQRAFNQFHANLHTGFGVTGEIGPQAPGLHNGQGGELTATGC